MPKIGITGAGGQMGGYYLKNLLEKLRLSPEQVIVWDINAGRLAAVLAKHPGLVAATSTKDLATKADAFIVLTNTPAHHKEIKTLAKEGARRILTETGTASILTEKPITQNVVELRKIRALERSHEGLQISTALVISFSPIRKILSDLIENENLVLQDAGGNWGKNRGNKQELRPTAGDLVDELIHMLEFILGLVRMREIQHINVISQLGYLNYVNTQAQRIAHERDSSFPLQPDHTSQVLLSAVLGNDALTDMVFTSSFLKAKQVRNIWGTFAYAGTNEPAYSFEANFDVKGADELLLTHIRSNEQREHRIEGDKLLALTSAFLESVETGQRDERLATVEWSGRFVELVEAIGESDRRRRTGKSRAVTVNFQPRRWFGLRRA